MKKKSVLITFSLILLSLSIIGCYLVAERFFFDKFFYQKSVLHGYYPNMKSVDDAQFGERGLGLMELKASSTTFTSTDASKYKILLIGDSYVWGVGILNHKRYANLLEGKLNSVRPTKVVSIGYPGWNSSEFRKYHAMATKNSTPDLTIFSLVHNDSLISRHNLEDETIQKCQSQHPQITPIVGIDVNKMIANNVSFTEIDKIFNEQHSGSWRNPVNLCVLESNLSNMPTDQTIYFLTDDYGGNNLYTTYTEILKKYHKNIISASAGKDLKKYNYLWGTQADTYKLLSISHKEAHPNATANQMYADVLFNEITNNPRWRFKPSQ